MNSEVISAIADLEKERGINADILFDAIEVALITAFKKNFYSNENVRVSMDRKTGEIHVYAQRKDNPKLKREKNFWNCKTNVI